VAEKGAVEHNRSASGGHPQDAVRREANVAEEMSAAQGGLEARVGELEKRAAKRRGGGGHGGTGFWVLGSAIAVVLSWSRNASILWMILHGIFSWGYVIYFAVTRK
jgi:hypothetical protein